MNVLEKILEEIEGRFEELRRGDDACRIYAECDRNFESMKYFQALIFANDRAKDIAKEIIRSHMADVPDTGYPTGRNLNEVREEWDRRNSLN